MMTLVAMVDNHLKEKMQQILDEQDITNPTALDLEKAEKRALLQTMDEVYFEYLDDLKERGVTDMFGAIPYLEEQFNISKHDANQALKRWMETLNERHKNEYVN